MPTYTYRREDGSTFEVFQKITDDPLEECPDTGQPVERVISGGQPPIFKGSGFYETDYKKNGGDSSASGQESGSDAGEGTSSGGDSTDTSGSSSDGDA